MTLTAEVTPRDDVVEVSTTLPRPAVVLGRVAKPAYAAAGLADLALEQVKDVPAGLSEVPAVVRTLPASVKHLREEVAARVGTARETAAELYAALADRGERLVTAVLRQPAAEAAVAEGRDAVRHAEAAATAARQAVEDAAQTH